MEHESMTRQTGRKPRQKKPSSVTPQRRSGTSTAGKQENISILNQDFRTSLTTVPASSSSGGSSAALLRKSKNAKYWIRHALAEVSIARSALANTWISAEGHREHEALDWAEGYLKKALAGEEPPNER
jgi:hypothetical protein